MNIRPFDLQSERYQPTGSISADGVRNQLGRPKIDRLTLLMREAVQNSWDARVAEGGVTFGVSGWELDASQRKSLASVVFRRLPNAGLSLNDYLKSTDLTLAGLAIYDRGTVGLCGPTRADKHAGGIRNNFVNLLRNIGHPPSQFRGGGTYGFGKTALFLASQARTIIAHSQIKVGSRTEQRLIGAALGSQYTGAASGTPRFTGRHWWGRSRGGIVEPLTGREASETAKTLGMPAFQSDETGTTIIVLFPDFDDQQPEDALKYMANAVLTSFWPKMVDSSNEKPSINFEFSWNGTRIPMPKPQDIPPLSAYVRAFSNLRAHIAKQPLPFSDGWIREIHSQRPSQHLGTLSLLKFLPEPRLAGVGGDDDTGPFQSKSHHTALMRGPHFVVRYLEGPALPYELAEYAGVFITSNVAEEAFAKSEPPTHDDWSPNVLENRQDKTAVRVGLKKIGEAMLEFSGVPAPDSNFGSTISLGSFSDQLGGLVPSQKGTGTRGTLTSNGRPSGNTGRHSPPEPRGATIPRIRLISQTQPQAISESSLPAVAISFTLEPISRRGDVAVVARTGVMLEDGNSEAQPPVGGLAPAVLWWLNDKGKRVTGNTLIVGKTERGPWVLAIAVPNDVVAAIDLDVEAIEP